MKQTVEDNVNTLDSMLGDSIINFLKSQALSIELHCGQWLHLLQVMDLTEMEKPLTSALRQLLKVNIRLMW
jgi:hypothetical protein